MITVGGNCKEVVMVFVSVFLFHSQLTTIGVVGIIITICGAVWYSYEELKVKKTEGYRIVVTPSQ